ASALRTKGFMARAGSTGNGHPWSIQSIAICFQVLPPLLGAAPLKAELMALLELNSSVTKRLRAESPFTIQPLAGSERTLRNARVGALNHSETGCVIVWPGFLGSGPFNWLMPWPGVPICLSRRASTQLAINLAGSVTGG